MGKAGEKQKRRPLKTDKKQSERFKQLAQELGVGETDTSAMERVLGNMAPPKQPKSSDDLSKLVESGDTSPETMDRIAKLLGQKD